MGIVAILVIWPRGKNKLSFLGDSIWNLAMIGQMVSEEKTFEECGQKTEDGVCLYNKLSSVPKGLGELKKKQQ